MANLIAAYSAAAPGNHSQVHSCVHGSPSADLRAQGLLRLRPQEDQVLFLAHRPPPHQLPCPRQLAVLGMWQKPCAVWTRPASWKALDQTCCSQAAMQTAQHSRLQQAAQIPRHQRGKLVCPGAPPPPLLGLSAAEGHWHARGEAVRRLCWGLAGLCRRLPLTLAVRKLRGCWRDPRPSRHPLVRAFAASPCCKTALSIRGCAMQARTSKCQLNGSCRLNFWSRANRA